MKKASTNVDWVISVGIFLTYLVFLFIFIKPGIHEVYDERALFNILQNNIYSEANYTLEIIPLIINNGLEANPRDIRCFGDFEKEWDESNTAVIDNNGGAYQGESLEFKFQGAGKKINFNAYLDTGINNFIIIHSDKEEYGARLNVCLGHQNECVPPIQDVDCKLGVRETLKGLFNESLNETPTSIMGQCDTYDKYQLLKESWNFPLNKEFSLYLKENQASDFTPFCNQEPESNQTNVFVKEFKEKLLDKYGNKKDVLINMRIW